jgi:hypothetical protein
VLSVVSAQLVSVPSELSHPPHKPRLKSTPFMRVLTSTPPSHVLVSRNSARTSSDPPPSQSIVFSQTPRLTSPRSTRSFLSVVPLVFPESRSSSPTTSTARSPTSQSTPMRLLHTVLQFKPPFSLVTLHPSPPTRFFSSMWRHCLSVSRLLVAR